MEVIDNSQTSANPVRNTFLTVLCCLTFLGSGWGVVKAIRTYFTADLVASVAGSAMEQATDKMNDKDVPAFAKNIVNDVGQSLTPENIRKNSIINLISNILTLTGGLLMWNLKRKGFWIYIAGIAIAIAMPLIFLGSGLVGLLASGGIGFFGVLFIVLYGVNLKYMVR